MKSRIGYPPGTGTKKRISQFTDAGYQESAATEIVGYENVIADLKARRKKIEESNSNKQKKEKGLADIDRKLKTYGVKLAELTKERGIPAAEEASPVPVAPLDEQSGSATTAIDPGPEAGGAPVTPEDDDLSAAFLALLKDDVVSKIETDTAGHQDEPGTSKINEKKKIKIDQKQKKEGRRDRVTELEKEGYSREVAVKIAKTENIIESTEAHIVTVSENQTLKEKDRKRIILGYEKILIQQDQNLEKLKAQKRTPEVAPIQATSDETVATTPDTRQESEAAITGPIEEEDVESEGRYSYNGAEYTIKERRKGGYLLTAPGRADVFVPKGKFKKLFTRVAEQKAETTNETPDEFAIGQQVKVLRYNKDAEGYYKDVEEGWTIKGFNKTKQTAYVVKEGATPEEELRKEVPLEKLSEWQTLTPTPAEESSMSPTQTETTEFRCPNCRNLITPNVTVCPWCAAPIVAPITPVPSQPQTSIPTPGPNPQPGGPRPPAPPQTLDAQKMLDLFKVLATARQEYFDLKNQKQKPGSKQFGLYEAKLKIKEKAYRDAKNEIVKELLDKGKKGEAQEFLLGEVEIKRKNDLENGFAGVGERFVAGVSKGIEKWDNWGTAEGWKGDLQRLVKTGVSLAVIGAVSGQIVQVAANAGLGTASALAGGVTAYLGRRMGFGLGLSAIMAKVPDDKKKWVTAALIAGSIGVAVATGGVAAGVFATGALVASSAIGLGVSRFFKKYDKKIEKNKKKVIGGNIDVASVEEDSKKMEAEMEKFLKESEKARMWGKVGQGAAAVAVSISALEIFGFAHDLTHAKTETGQEKPTTTTNNAERQTTTTAPVNHPDTSNHHITTPPAHVEAHTVNPDAVIHKNEGIEHAFRRQIEHDGNLARSLGFKGDINDPKALHQFSGGAAHRLALNHGYVDGKTGEEIRIKGPDDEVAYQIKSENGEIKIDEIKVHGGLIEEHGQGDKFGVGNKAQSYEYKHNGPDHHNIPGHIDEKISHTATSTARAGETAPANNPSVDAARAKVESMMNQTQPAQAATETANTSPSATQESIARATSDAPNSIWNRLATENSTANTSVGRGIAYGGTNPNAYGTNTLGPNYYNYTGEMANGEFFYTDLSAAQNHTLNSLLHHFPQFADNPFHLNGHQLMQAIEASREGIHHIVRGHFADWEDIVKQKVGSVMELKNTHSTDTRLVEYFTKLQNASGEKMHMGFGSRHIFGENTGEYMTRALEKLAAGKGNESLEKFIASVNK
jgi:hypothetical protein